MARDYAKIKAMAQSILECCGDEEEGENPKLPKADKSIDDGGQDSERKMMPKDKGDMSTGKGKMGDMVALFTTHLASKFKK